MEIKDYLKEEYDKRLSRNSRYTLSAFARDLGMSPQKLYLVMNGRSGLSSTSARKVAEKLKIDDVEKEKFILYVDSRHHRSQTARVLAQKKLNNFLNFKGEKKLKDDSFKLISEWYYLPLLFLLDLNVNLKDTEEVSLRLGIDTETVKKAIDQLVQVGLLSDHENGYIKNSNHYSYAAVQSSPEIINYYRQMLNQAEKTLEFRKELRSFSVLLSEVNSDEIDEIKNEIEEFRKKIRQRVSSSAKKPNRLYGLSIQWFPILKELSHEN